MNMQATVFNLLDPLTGSKVHMTGGQIMEWADKNVPAQELDLWKEQARFAMNQGDTTALIRMVYADTITYLTKHPYN